MKATAAFWLAPLLVSVPLFSRDTYSYLAQGALLRDGFDPYVVAPIENSNSLLDNVSPIWTTTTAPYGPAFILVAKFVTLVVGDHVIAGTILLRLCMLPGLALLVWAAPRVARHIGADGAIALWICALNPLVIIHLMGGVHNEMLMVGLMMAGIALMLTRRHIAGAALIAVGVAAKATAILALPFMVWVWMRHLRGSRLRAFATASAESIAAFVAVFAVLSTMAGVGLGWLTALAGRSPFAAAFRSTDAGDESGSAAILAELRTLTPEQWPDRLRRLVTDQVALILRRAIDPDRPFAEHGLDSLGNLELRTHIESQTGVRVTAKTIVTYNTARALAGHLTEALSDG
jgi:carotene biosynthesis associated membrane protein